MTCLRTHIAPLLKILKIHGSIYSYYNRYVIEGAGIVTNLSLQSVT